MATSLDDKQKMSPTELQEALDDFWDDITRKQRLTSIVRKLCEHEYDADYHASIIELVEQEDLDNTADRILINIQYTSLGHDWLSPVPAREKLYRVRIDLINNRHALCYKKLKLDHQELGEPDKVVWRSDFSELSDAKSAKETLDKDIEDVRTLEAIFDGIYERMQARDKKNKAVVTESKKRKADTSS